MDITSVLRKEGCLLEPEPGGKMQYHFVSHGMHVDRYYHLSRMSPSLVWQVAEALANAIPTSPQDVGVVFSPALPPSSTLAQFMALQLSMTSADLHVDAAWAWQSAGTSGVSVDHHVPALLRRGGVVLVAGVIDNAQSVVPFLRFLRDNGGWPLFVAAVVAPLDLTVRDLHVPLVRLHKSQVNSWTETDCQREGPCARRVPIVTNQGLGGGRQFLKRHPTWPPERFIHL